MSRFDSLSDAIRDTLEAGFSQFALGDLARREIAPLSVALITEHAQAGVFAGGEYADRGYSTSTLPAFFLGDLEKTAGGQWRIRSVVSNVTVKPGKEKLIWRTGQGGRRIAYLVGGYKEFRRLAGRTTSFVNLTFTGRMLQSVRGVVGPSGSGVEIRVGGSGGQQDKVAFTDAQREWLYLSNPEMSQIDVAVERFINHTVDGLDDALVVLP